MSDRLIKALADVGIRLKSYKPHETYELCPNCSAHRKPANRKKPCLSVKLDHDGGAVWKCHNCDWAGNVPGEGGYRPRQDASEQREVRPPPIHNRADYRPAAMLKFFAKRGISAELVEAMGIHLHRIFMPQTGHKEACIAFPYRVDGQVVNHKYRDQAKNFRQDKESLRSLYNRDSLKDREWAVFVEGEMDVLAVLEAMGEDSPCVSLPDGAPKTHKQEIDPDEKRYWPLKEAAALLARLDFIVIAGDMDKPGEALAHQIAQRLGPARCRFVRWPPGCKDANETLLKHGAEIVTRSIHAAEGWPLKGLEKPTAESIDAFARQSQEAKYAAGIPVFDDYLTFRKRQVLVVTGYPGSGKSSWMDFLAVSLARRYGWRWAIFSPEHEVEEQSVRLMEQYKMMPFFQYGEGHRPMDSGDRADALAWVRAHFTWIRHDDEKERPTVDFVLEKAKEAWIRDRISGVIIDPYNELEHDRGNEPEHEYVGRFMRRLITFSRSHDLLTSIIAHPSKPSPDRKRAGSGTAPKGFHGPSLYDISGSAHWFNRTMLGMSVDRPELDTPAVDVLIAKCKRKDQGRRGLVPMKWDTYTSRYEFDIARGTI